MTRPRPRTRLAGRAAGMLATVLLAALAALAAAPPADAQRRPSAAERLEIANAVGVPKRCLVTRVSTVDERWAVTWLRRCGLGGGSAVFFHKRGLWRDSYTGPDEPRGLPCRRIGYVRERVARDLELCR